MKDAASNQSTSALLQEAYRRCEGREHGPFFKQLRFSHRRQDRPNTALSRQDFGDLISVSYQTIESWENSRKFPTATDVDDLATFIRVTVWQKSLRANPDLFLYDESLDIDYISAQISVCYQCQALLKATGNTPLDLIFKYS